MKRLAVVIAIVVGSYLGVRAAAPPFELPLPTGLQPVGTTSWRVTDDARREGFAAGKEPRQIEVIAWYPAAPNAGRATAPYLREGLSEVRAFASLLKPENAFDALGEVKTHARLDADPKVDGSFPVLIFSHGFTGVPSAYTALAEDLASHGYAVLSVVHPYEATAATLNNGRIASMLDEKGAFLQPTQDIFAEWTTEDDAMAAVTRATTDEEQLKLLRGYLSKLPKTDLALRRWVDDEKVVLDRLKSISSKTAAGKLVAALDLNRIGVFGHSMGGVTAGQFCLEDRRCRAGLNLDGSPQSGTVIDGKIPVPFLMVYSERLGRAGANDAVYRRAASPYIRIDVAGTRHLDFSDMTFWGGPLRERPMLGTIAPGRVTEITRMIVRQYFDQELRGFVSPLLTGRVKVPEVSVRR